MRKKLLCSISVFFILICLVCISLCLISGAVDDASVYGDGVSASWDDINGYLSPVYSNTPCIYIPCGSSSVRLDFNIELYMDMGLYVYGDPSSLNISGILNDFAAVEYGYFTASGKGGTVKGEYRYIGYSISGAPVTNSRFPNDAGSGLSDLVLIKYTDIPDKIKEQFNIKGLDNDMYGEIRELIESQDSPVWDFVNINGGVSVTLKQRMSELGLIKDGAVQIKLLDYAIVYSWAETGGIIRLFFQSASDKDIIRYATFTGAVSADFTRKAPILSSNISVLGDGNPFYAGNGTFYMWPYENHINISVRVSGIMHDSYADLTEFAKKYSYTRDNLKSFNLYAEEVPASDINLKYGENDVEAAGYVYNYTINRHELSAGRNIITIEGSAVVRLDNKYITSDCSTDITILCLSASPPPSSLPVPSQSQTPEASSAPSSNTPDTHFAPGKTPSPTPHINVKRKW